MIKITRSEADYIRNVMHKPQFVHGTVGTGKKKTLYAVEDPRVLYALKNMRNGEGV